MNEFSTSDFEDTEPGGSTYIPPTSTTMSPDLRYLINAEAGDTFNNPAGNTSDNYSMPGAYTVDANGVRTNLTGLSGLANAAKNFLTDNRGLVLAGGALAGLMGAGDTKYGKTGYQGTIPRLGASRTMITAPPTRAQGYRPGAGGIDYGGDVTYTRMPDGTDPWAGLSGTSGTAANANTVPTGISNIVTGNTTVTGNTNKTGLTQAEQDALAVANWKKGLTPQQYLSQINQWIADRPNLTTAELTAALDKFKVSKTDLQTALSQNKALSPADIYALSQGQGLKEANALQNTNINKWIADNPYATAQQIKDAIKGSGVDTRDINEALAGTKLSGAAQAALIGGMGLDQLYKNILDYQVSGHTPAEIAAAKAQYKVSDADMAAAEKFAKDQGYTAKVQAAVPTSSFGDSVKAILADQKAVENQSVNANLANLGLGATNKADVVDTYQPYDNTDYSYMQFAEGGEIAMAKGRYLQGGTDGMADELPARIGANQPAALSHGEFVIPADVVSHMGNGNSDAGAKKLYQMMDKIRMARTGNKKQGKKINPDKFMPGGLAASKYATGGAVKKFEVGGLTTANKNATAAGVSGVESNLSNWAGDYTTNMLGQGQALANLPYTAYMGPLTAGESPLQTGAFKTAAGLTTPTSIGTAASEAGKIGTAAQGLKYTPTTSTFDTTQATAYMNPYLTAALEPQLAEARRQSQLTQQMNAGKMTAAGAFGGGRQAILDAETQRSLGANLANITGAGYSTAYDKAMAQFNADQARKAQEAQFGATYGLQGLQTGLQAAQAQGNLGATESQTGLANLQRQLEAGAAQRGIESEGIAADKAQFEEARANPYKMVQFQQSLLQGLPLAAQSYSMPSPSNLTNIGAGVTTAADLLDVLLGKTPAKKA
jgi:hypothetical protein